MHTAISHLADMISTKGSTCCTCFFVMPKLGEGPWTYKVLVAVIQKIKNNKRGICFHRVNFLVFWRMTEFVRSWKVSLSQNWTSHFSASVTFWPECTEWHENSGINDCTCSSFGLFESTKYPYGRFQCQIWTIFTVYFLFLLEKDF